MKQRIYLVYNPELVAIFGAFASRTDAKEFCQQNPGYKAMSCFLYGSKEMTNETAH